MGVYVHEARSDRETLSVDRPAGWADIGANLHDPFLIDGDVGHSLTWLACLARSVDHRSIANHQIVHVSPGLVSWKSARTVGRGGATVPFVAPPSQSDQPTQPLALPPAGFLLRLDPSVRRIDRGRILVGGAPLKILRLSDSGADAVDEWDDGEPLDEPTSHRRLARRLLDAGMAHPYVDPATVTDLDVTVVVPVRDNPEGLDRCLAALRATGAGGAGDASGAGGAGGRGERKVIVVDDASSDDDSSRRISSTHGAVFVSRDVSGGPGAARMTGFDLVDTEFVAFVDSDVEVRPGWIARLGGHFADPVVAAVAPRVRSRRGSDLLAAYERQNSPLDLGDAAGLVGPGRMVSYLPTAALIVRSTALREVGGFDPDLRWGEDVDLIWRLTDRSEAVRYEPSVEVIHDHRPDWRAWFQQRRRYGASAAALAVRHGDKVAPARCSRWSAGAWGLVAAGHPVVGVAVAAGSSAALAKRLESLPHPTAEAARLAGRGHAMAGLGLARATVRVWWPLVVALAMVFPRRRAALAAVMLTPAISDWIRGVRPAGALQSIALRTADDMAYGVGVWEGAISRRTVVPLLPRFSEYPGRRAAVDDTTVG